MSDLKLYVREFDDQYLRENFRKTLDFVEAQPILNGDFRFVEIVITGNKTNLKFKHNFTFTPKDVIQTYAVFSGGVGTITWNYSRFDATNLDITTASLGATDTCTVRALIGRF